MGAAFQVLKHISNGKLKPIISTTLLFEYEGVLKRKQSELALSNTEIDIILDNLCALGEFQEIHYLWRPYLKDPKDDYVLEVCVASKSKQIITYNIKDFKGIEKFGIQAISPKDLLEALK